MSAKLMSIVMSIIIGSAFAMEQKDADLKAMLLEAPTLKLLSAWQAAKQPIDPARIPAELLEFVNGIKVIQGCAQCTEDEKKLFINILNNPEIDIEKAFPELIEKYLGKEKFTSLKQLFNKILLRAAKDNKIGLVNLALKFGADINFKGIFDKTALIEAVEKNSKEIVAMLLNNGADVNIADKFGDTALIAAIQNNSKDIIALLLGKGASIKVAALKLAAKKPNKEIFQMLMAKGVDINLKDWDGETALMWAVKGNENDAVKLLLSNGADVNVKNKYGQTTLSLAVNSNNNQMVKLLLEAGADVNIKDKDGYTALMSAILAKNKAIAQMLLAKAADVNIKNNAGSTALTLAQQYNLTEMNDLMKSYSNPKN